MNIEINGFDAETGKVNVTFNQDGFAHTREVNAVLDEDGAYDATATFARCEEVGLGVAHKIAAGLIQPDDADGEESE